MGLKYYLRGLGLGIVVTAIIMGIASSGSNAMTDEEIIARAKQLGMIEGRVLSETASDDEENSENNSGAGENDSVKEDGSVQTDDTADVSTLTDENELSDEPEGITVLNDTSMTTLPDDEETGQGEMQTEPNESEAQAAAETQDESETQTDSAESEEAGQSSEASDTPMVITVGSGDGSYTVSKKLEDVGAVASASAFDTFLCENGYDKRIRSGSYTIPADAGEEQIARMITGLE